MAKEINITGLEKIAKSEYITNNGNRNLHVSAFDYQEPIMTLLGELGIGKGPDYIHQQVKFIEEVNKGAKVIASNEQKEFAKKFLYNWQKLIGQAKQGTAPKTDTPFGEIEIEYDKDRIISKEHWNKFNEWVTCVCAIAQYDSKETIEKMLN